MVNMAQTLGATSTMAKAPDPIRQTAEEYEGIFLTTLMQTMFANLETDGPFGGGQAESMYRSMMVEQYGASMARSGGIGIADAIAREMIALQEI